MAPAIGGSAVLLLPPSTPSETLPGILPSPPSEPLAKGAIGLGAVLGATGLEPPLPALSTALLNSALSRSAGSGIDVLAATASSPKSAEF